MEKSKTGIKITVAVVIVITVIAAGFAIKSKLSWYSEEDPVEVYFEAVITEIYESSILVDGVNINGQNYQGGFVCSVSDDTKICWNDTEISFEDLEAGDSIGIFFTGDISETAPAQISEVTMIILHDDEL